MQGGIILLQDFSWTEKPGTLLFIFFLRSSKIATIPKQSAEIFFVEQSKQNFLVLSNSPFLC